MLCADRREAKGLRRLARLHSDSLGSVPGSGLLALRPVEELGDERVGHAWLSAGAGGSCVPAFEFEQTARLLSFA